MLDIPDVFIFFGRFHPLLVHLPIGFLCLSILLEIFFRGPGYDNFQPIIKFVWLLAALSSTLAVLLGYLLSLQGGYDEQLLSTHKWTGIFLAVVTHLCYFSKKYQGQRIRSRFLLPVLCVIAAVALTVTGHFGGSLTHGSDYLAEYAPGSFSELIGISEDGSENGKKIYSLDSADIFSDAIMPIMKSKCISCHNASKKKGKLILSAYDDMVQGGEDGPGVVPGDLKKSEIYNRITLDPEEKGFMPAEGKKPLTSQQVAIIKWWIEKKAPKAGMVSALHPDSAAIKMFTAYFGINNRKSGSDLDIVAPAASPSILEEIRNLGFLINPIAQNSNLLKATYNGARRKTIDIKKLEDIKEQLVWLQITNAGQMDDHLKIIGRLKNLRKLNLNNNMISDKGITPLLDLPHLEYINLYGSQVTDNAVNSLVAIKTIRQIYVWDTKVNELTMDSLSVKYPEVKIVYKSQPNELTQ